MRQTTSKFFSRFVFSALALMLVFSFLPANPASADIGTWEKSVSIQPRWNTDFSSSSFQQSVKNAQGTNANYITMGVPLYQSNVNSTDVSTNGSTPTDQSLTDGANYVHSLGMHVAWKIQVLPGDGQWSALINPSDRTTWFNNYDALLIHYGQLAKQDGVEQIILGTELEDMTEDNVNSTNTANWDTLITKVRAVYGGALTYAANWGVSGKDDEKDNVNFWNKLDSIGIDAYFNLSGDNSVSNLVSDWQNEWAGSVQALSTKWNKPIIFTEVGYKAITNSHNNPWMWWQGGNADQTEQSNDYTALFQFWNGQSYIQGVNLWYWSSDPNAGGPNDNDYTPQNKLAQQTMTQWFGKSGGGGGGPSTGSSFSASAYANPNSPTSGQQTAISVKANNTGNNAASNDLTDVEIYNNSNQQVLQKVYNNQNFSAGGSQSYNFNWTPTATGNYTLKIGVFSNDWSQNYYWGDAVLTIGSGGGGGGGTGSSTPGSINIWWPTNGATVSGVQPFKAMLTNNDVDQYNMYWQVDSGQLNVMANNSTDYPHKESLVDVSGWSWNGHGPYLINFIAKDLSGNILNQYPINIYTQ